MSYEILSRKGGDVANKVLKTPIQSEDVEQLKIGDIAFLEGCLVTCRDMANRRLIDMGMQLPVGLEGLAI